MLLHPVSYMGHFHPFDSGAEFGPGRIGFLDLLSYDVWELVADLPD